MVFYGKFDGLYHYDGKEVRLIPGTGYFDVVVLRRRRWWQFWRRHA